LKPYLERIQETNFRLSQAVVNQLLREAGE
jgi:predicted nucleic acid-binding protein